MQSSTVQLKRNIHFSEEGTPVFRKNRQPRICIKYCLTIHYDFDETINVTFPDQSTDILVLKKVPGEETVFQGSLFKEKSAVSVIVENASNPDIIKVVTIYTILYFLGDYNAYIKQSILPNIIFS